MRKIFKLFMLLFIIGMTVNAQAQVTVNVTGTTNTTPNLAASYPSLLDALNDLNAIVGMSGPVVFTLAAGSETAPIKGFILGSASLNPLLGPTNTITINTAGAVTINADVGTSNGPSATPDGMFVINGADYVTIDGITFTDGNITNATVAMEFGIALFKRDAGDGSNNNTIQNCTFNMQRVNNASGSGPMVEGSVGIGVYNSVYTAATTALTPTNGGTLETNGTNSNNKFYSNSFNSGNYGIALNGFAASAGVGPTPDPLTFLGDLNNDIGGSSLLTGNTILNYGGGGTNASAGIRANNQWGINISYNTVNNNNGSGVNHPGTLRGIYAQAGTSSNATITYNNVTIKGGGTTSQVAAIESGMGTTPLSNTVSISNNTITGEYLTATSGVFYGIFSNSATPTTLNIQNNSVNGWNYSAAGLTGTGANYPIYQTGSNAGTTINATGNSVNNVTRTGTTGGTTIGIFIAGSITGMVVNANNNTVTNMSIDGAGTASTMYGMQTSTGTISMNNNLINNLSCIKITGTGVLYGIYNIASPVNENYNNNTVHTLTHNGTGTVYGIYAFTTTGTRTMSGNTVHTLSTAGTTIAGLNNASSSPNVFKNKVYGITSTSAGAPIVSGILQGSLGTAGTANIYNNLIGNLNAPNASSNDAIRGINITTTTTSSSVNVSYNTVYINASSVGVNFGTTGIFHTTSTTATTASLTLMNNIIYNNSTASGTGLTVAYRRNNGIANMLSNYNAASNNNLFYAGTPSATNVIYTDGTSTAETMSDYKNGIFTAGTIAPRDAQSFSENPTFLSTVGSSPNFLHPDPNVPTSIESGAIEIMSITDDFSSTPRYPNMGYPEKMGFPPFAPDVGAIEFGGEPLDFNPPVIAYTPFSNTSITGVRTLTATITDPSGVPTAGIGLPVLYWSINNIAGPFTASTGSYVAGDDYQFNFGAGAMLGDNVYYYVVAQDGAATPNVGSNPGGGSGYSPNPPAATTPPPAPHQYQIVPTISGIIPVGIGETYTSLTADAPDGLFKTINASALTGNITIQITTNLTETGAVSLNKASEDAIYTISIVPSSASMKTISGDFAGGLIRLNGTENVEIDGNFMGSGRFLTFENTSTATNTAAIQLISNGVGEGASNNVISNSIIRGGSNTVVSAFGIHIGGPSILATGTGANNNSNTINDNVFEKAYYGIYASGAAGSGMISGLTIANNLIGSNIPADVIGNNGIRLANADNVIITGNEIFGFITANTTIQINGIEISSNVTNSVISNNIIRDLTYTATLFRAPKGISITSGSGANIEISNNVMYGFNGHASTTAVNNSYGIMLLGGTGYNVYYNTINMNGTFGNSATNIHGGIYVASSVSSVNIVDNNIAIQATFGTFYGVYSLAANTAYTEINYNNYYLSSTPPPSSTYAVGFLSSARATLADWQTATAQDVNSISANPLFFGASDLRPLVGSPVIGAGTPIVGITTDILGDTRSVTTPTIGAYEDGVAPPSVDVGISSIVNPVAGQIINANGSDINAYVMNFGSVVVSDVDVYYDLNGGTPVGPVVVAGPINPGDSALVTFTGANQLTSMSNLTGTVTVYTDYPGDGNVGNDALSVANVFLRIPPSSFPYFSDFSESPSPYTLSGSAALWGLFLTTNPDSTINDPAARANFYGVSSGSQILRSTLVDLTGTTNPLLSFYRAYTTYTTPESDDALQVVVSTNGGLTWSAPLYSRSWFTVPSLGTLPAQSGSFAPSAPGQWMHNLVDLSAYAGQEIVVGFNAISAFGNNLWLDNIKVSDADNISLIPVNAPGLYGNLMTNGVQINFTALRPGLGNGVVTQTDNQGLWTPENVVFGHLSEATEEREQTSKDGSMLSRNTSPVSPDASEGVLALSRVDDFPVNNVYQTNTTATTFNGAIYTPDVIADRYWEVAFSGNDHVSTATYDVILDISSQLGITAYDSLYIVKRVDQNSPWVCLNTITDYDMGVPVRLISTGLTGFSQFGIASADGTLPVDLIEFSASVDRNNVTLNWTTAWEENNMRFDVQRRIAETDAAWATVGSVTGNGTTQEQKSYSYLDRNLVTGIYEYKLVQVDFDGNSTADHTLSSQVEVGIPTEFALSQNYPNPFNPTTKIDFQIPVEGLVKLSVYDMSGREVATLVNEALTPGYYTYTFNGANFASGVYFYRLVSSNSVMTKRAVLVK